MKSHTTKNILKILTILSTDNTDHRSPSKKQLRNKINVQHLQHNFEQNYSLALKINPQNNSLKTVANSLNLDKLHQLGYIHSHTNIMIRRNKNICIQYNRDWTTLNLPGRHTPGVM